MAKRNWIKVYPVWGKTGEYADLREWIVTAYTSKKRAEKHAADAMNAAREIFCTRPDRYSVPEPGNPFDPEMSMDYTGTEYYVGLPLKVVTSRARGGSRPH